MSNRFRIDKPLGDFLLAVPGISDLIGTRLFPDEGPLNVVWPFAVFGCKSSNADKTLNRGVLKSRTAQYQVEIWSKSKTVGGQIANLWTARAQDAGIDGFRGVMGSGDSSVFVQFAFVDDVRDEMVEPQTAEETLYYTTTIDLRIKFNT